MTDIILERRGNFSEDFVRWSLYQVAKGLAAMHSKNVLHRDIKSDNILCRPSGDVKLADLGFSVFLSEQTQYRMSQKGTPSWVSPEIARGVQYSKEVDVWSFGCYAYELVQAEPPHHSHFQNGLDALLDAIIKLDVPPVTGNWSPELKDFISKCFIRDPKQRWTFAQLLGHELF